ncbi:predicted protein [Pyrenophora tritici-repentis Pt-1C-BFP]|uniref:Uncharacterized protein n=1 Tax=Pyrenophora tritici-repentis (strain Pt-1C-BFP) TaxID=426418 RepID=B2W423_PYRTR|nr:uncharacterized protein PTRG_05223 [Pyrenophora tritici-repentis Pt-1C-BFP]EDU48130.1 predicted protein [Pyrenophora tritici-repentis Pt-1C-BFP]
MVTSSTCNAKSKVDCRQQVAGRKSQTLDADGEAQYSHAAPRHIKAEDALHDAWVLIENSKVHRDVTLDPGETCP